MEGFSKEETWDFFLVLDQLEVGELRADCLHHKQELRGMKLSTRRKQMFNLLEEENLRACYYNLDVGRHLRKDCTHHSFF